MIQEQDEELANEEWYIQGFNANPLFVDFAAIGGVVDMPKLMGYGYDCFISSNKNDFCDFHYHVDSLKRIYEELMARHEEDEEYVPTLIKRTEAQYAEIEANLTRVMPVDETISDEELLRRLKKLFEDYNLTAGIPHLVEGFSLNADREVNKLLFDLLEKLERQKEHPKIVTKLTMPSRMSFLGENEQRIQTLMEQLKSEGLAEKIDAIDDLQNTTFWMMLEEYVAEYYWIRGSYAGSPLNTTEWTLGVIKQHMQENGAEKVEVTTKEEKEALIAELNITGRLLDLLHLSDIITSYHDDRKKMILKCATVIDQHVAEVAKRYNLPHDLLRQLTPEEFTDERLRSTSKEELQDRKTNGLIVVYDGGPRRHYTGEEFTQFDKLLSVVSRKDKMREIPGMCASIGRAIGRVSICKSLDAIENFQKGDVLVTSMTRPEYLPAMKKAAAIVTDEGGVTCHAAIISREIGKPCLIGTSNATTLLQDGDLVEVRADHGMLVIVERA